MFASSFDPNNRPLFFISGFPVWLSTILVVLHSLMLIVVAATGGWLNQELALAAHVPFLENDVVWPSWWQWGTYFVCNFPSAWFLLDMYFLWVFGKELEERMGRRFFSRLYLLLIAIGSLTVVTALSTGLSREAFWAGPGIIHFCVFLAIAFLEPDAPVFILHIKLKYLAAALLAINLLRFIQVRSGIGCAILGLSVVATYVIMRRYGLTPRFARVAEAFSAALPRPRGKVPAALPYTPKVVPRPELREDRVVVAKIDAILEKISRSGLDSLTAEERTQLERASTELKRQDG